MPRARQEFETYMRNVGFNLRVSYDGSGRQEYVGMCYPNTDGTTDSAAVFQIYKLTYDGNGRMTHRYYADGTDEFIKVWNDRTTYTYA